METPTTKTLSRTTISPALGAEPLPPCRFCGTAVATDPDPGPKSLIAQIVYYERLCPSCSTQAVSRVVVMSTDLDPALDAAHRVA